MENKIKVVRSMKDANVLLEKGHKIIRLDRDKFNRNFLIFLFEFNDEIEKDLRMISASR